MLTDSQRSLVDMPFNAKTLLSGPAGCGKTTAAVARILALIEGGAPADSILLLTPQRGLQNPYLEAIASQPYAGGEITPATMGGLARRMVDLFWPLAAQAAGFAHPDQPPVFLTLETAQYYMAHLVRPMLDQGFFESVTIDRNRLYSQILDNLNKAAVVGFRVDEIGEQLTSAWSGDPAQRRVYADAQESASRFRAYCLEHNLLDFSLQFEVFANILWNEPAARDFLSRTYRHLIYDNIEEEGPRAHDLLEEWLPEFDSALLVSDSQGGFRQFLGADPLSATRFESMVDEIIRFEDSFVQDEAVLALESGLLAALGHEPSLAAPVTTDEEPPEEQAFDFVVSRFYPELLNNITLQIQGLIEDGIPPAEIAVLSPYLSDSLRFAMMNRLETAGIPTRSHRPSRSLRDEPASQVLLTLACLAHPAWEIHPTRFDLTYALTLALEADLVRAQLLTEITYRQRDLRLSGFDEINPEMQERITYSMGGRYTQFREWILAYRESAPLPLDHFLRKLFGELLSQPGFGFHQNLDQVRVAASLIESVRKFRLALDALGETDPQLLGKEYIAMQQDGVIAAQYLQPYQIEAEAVLVAPATTFLLMNRPVTVQFWLDAGSSGWSERLSQPLTQPYVLSRGWQTGRIWTDADEVSAENEALARLVSGLLRRCRRKIYLGLPELGETGVEQRGTLLRAFQRVLQNASPAE
ncbi:MAG: hypothetical protein CVU44_21900 [Chloroflexi bacterium HGW-Chloroflexi-6]|nr:MAG: hypothetical protein CVU44_21900 [Chloroflexi bacterium HGW-Chloroflexi-6]